MLILGLENARGAQQARTPETGRGVSRVPAELALPEI